LRVRRNYPDGFTAYLRRRFPEEVYAGNELEINQDIVLAGGEAWRRLRALVIASLMEVLDRLAG
jgi:hypothetical protein